MSLDNTVISVSAIIRGHIKDLEKTDGRDAEEFNTNPSFTLSEPFVSEPSIQVFQNGNLLATQDWDYNSSTNQVTIVFVTTGGALNKDDVILITYSYFKKYSDTEIKAFISSSFSYFVENRYKKIFEVNEDDEIVSCNDVDPTQRELHFIAIIASILIDPQNIDIRTPDFQLSAQRDKSDREQIAEAFTRFQKFVGEVDFDERDHHGHH